MKKTIIYAIAISFVIVSLYACSAESKMGKTETPAKPDYVLLTGSLARQHNIVYETQSNPKKFQFAVDSFGFELNRIQTNPWMGSGPAINHIVALPFTPGLAIDMDTLGKTRFQIDLGKNGIFWYESTASKNKKVADEHWVLTAKTVMIGDDEFVIYYPKDNGPSQLFIKNSFKADTLVFPGRTTSWQQ